MREIVENIRRRELEALMEARVDHTTPGKNISSIATMLTTTMRALKQRKIKIMVARKSIEAIMKQYLRTMKDSTWDSLRDEFTSGDDKDSNFALYLTREWQTVPKYNNEREITKLAKEWAMEINRGGYEFAMLMGMKPGMRRLKPKDETIKLYDEAKNATDPIDDLGGGSKGTGGNAGTGGDLEAITKEAVARVSTELANLLVGQISGGSSVFGTISSKMTQDEKNVAFPNGPNKDYAALIERAVAAAKEQAKKTIEDVLKSKKW